MKINIEGSPQELAALVSAIQGRQEETSRPTTCSPAAPNPPSKPQEEVIQTDKARIETLVEAEFRHCPAGQRGPIGGPEADVIPRIAAEFRQALTREGQKDADGNISVLVGWWMLRQAVMLLENYALRLKASQEERSEIIGNTGGSADDVNGVR